MSWLTHDELARSFRERGATGERRCPEWVCAVATGALQWAQVPPGNRSNRKQAESRQGRLAPCPSTRIWSRWAPGFAERVKAALG